MGAMKTGRELLAEKGLLKDVVALSVAGKVVDLHTPIDEGAEYTRILSTDPQGLAVIRHSTAHVMADAVQRLFPGTKVTIGPSIDDGFYYDFAKAEGTFSEEDLAKIEKAMLEIVGKKSPFRRVPVSRDEALARFRGMGESFKVEIIERIPAGEEISLYFHGEPGHEWVDVCEGPHVPNTGYLKAIKLTSVAGAYWRGDEKNPMLQRIYGTAFPSKEALEEHLRLLEEAKQRDHRKLGKELDLFLFDPVAPAMPFFLPKGAYVYNSLVSFVRNLYEGEGYEEVITPQAFDPRLFRTSGHLGNYNENMYRLWTEDEVDGVAQAHASDPAKAAALGEVLRAESFALKPMNCPSHCIIFGSRKRSYRELPWRVADFGRLHRYERGGVVHGLSRVRSFCQDDAHIFCTRAQVPAEIEKFIGFLNLVYKAFGFERIDIKLATRPDKRIGTEADWDEAEAALEQGLKNAGLPFEITPGEGAFYGPKVEFHIHDALKRSWQLGTIQYDPNLPERFDLGYVGEDGKEHRPIMLHRAILGSLERFFSVYLEHSGGNFPAWIAPRQAVVLTVSEKVDAYATDVARRLRERGLRVDLDVSADKLGAKIRNARLARFPYMLVVGAKEAETGAVGVRSRDKGELGAMPVDTFAELLLAEGRPPSARV
ncbi:MAG: threonine--tRNA ligase [Myxococcales bacterium]|nr:threonine--tRNA ligase [Myxococcales bacterium]MBL0198429.1 threonine--tRNA ligase [Myxococcales bacterium]